MSVCKSGILMRRQSCRANGGFVLLPHFIVISVVSVATIIFETGAVWGQDYPTKPLRIVTSDAGGAGDFVSRTIGPGLTAALGQQIVIENRPANAAEIVAKAAPDGYTLLLYGPTVWITPLVRKAPWDPLKDLAPVTLTVRAPNLLVVTPSLPVRSVKELIALAKARPGELNFASSETGSSTHLAAELFKFMARVNIVRINYKGPSMAINDIISGRVQLMFLAANSVKGHVKSGKLRALAVTTEKPSQLFPGMPTVAVAVPGYESAAQFGFFAPAKTPAPIIDRLNQEAVRFLNRPEAKEKFFNAGMEVIASSPEQFAAMLKYETAKWTKVINAAGIREE
jgi:tripartite-type tricarboxylate transporter receptor subunit TctC